MIQRLAIAGIFVALAVLPACTPSQPSVIRTAGAPALPPSAFVEMLDAPPSRKYEQLAVIDFAGEPGALRAQVIAQIRTQAQQLGADAVILRDLSRTAPAAPRLNPTTGTYENIGGQSIPAFQGIAIRYL